jgi:hypothetical protein
MIKTALSLVLFISFSIGAIASDKSHWMDRKIEAWDRYIKFKKVSGSWYEADALWEMQSKKAYRDCENNVTTKYNTYYDIYFKVNSDGKAIEIEWYPDTNDGGCISNFLQNYEFTAPPTTMPLWLKMYPGEI